MTKVKVMRATTYSRIKNLIGRPPFCIGCKEDIKVGQRFKAKRSGGFRRRFHLDCWNNVICYFCGKRINMDKKGKYDCHHINENPKDERLENLADSHDGCHNSYHKKGKPLSKQHKQAISKALKGKPFSEEHKRNLSKAMKEANKGSKNPFFGKHHSEATKRKISDMKKGKFRYICKLCKTPVPVGKRTKHLREKHPELGKVKSKDYFTLNPNRSRSKKMKMKEK